MINCTRCGGWIAGLAHEVNNWTRCRCQVLEKENKMKYPNVEKLGITIETAEETARMSRGTDVVYAGSLEALLESAQVVYGSEECEVFYWNRAKNNDDTHSAKLLCIQPIVKGVTKAEIREVLEARNKNGNYDLLLQRILAEGIRND
jgi:hypothetical protein